VDRISFARTGMVHFFYINPFLASVNKPAPSLPFYHREHIKAYITYDKATECQDVNLILACALLGEP
jgi:hypothetical protein